MIRVKKSEAPAELAQSGYTCEAVKQALILDGDQKCFICERQRDTDLQVEHLQSRTNYPELEDNWGNLYIACDYCNKRKSSYHDDMLHPDQCDVEELIDHRVDLMGEVAQFSSTQATADVQSTDLDLVRNSVANGCGKDAPGNLAYGGAYHHACMAYECREIYHR